MALTELTQALAETEIPADRKAISRKIDTLISKVNDLDVDFAFDKKLAESMLKQRMIEEKKAKKSKRKKEKRQEQETLKKKEENAAGGEDDGDGEGGGMLGSMWDMETTDGASEATQQQHNQSVRQRQMANPSWSGGSPKVILAEFCRKKDRYAKITYKKAPRSTPAASMAIVTITWGSGSVSSADMTEEGCENMAEAENYAATKMLYELTPLPIYRSLPPTYRDLWLEWIDEKESAGRLAKKAVDGDRLSFIKALTAKLPSPGSAFFFSSSFNP